MPTGKIFCFFAGTKKSKAISMSCVVQGMVCLGFEKDAEQGLWLFLARALI
jgi:hypothetical protein